MQALSRLLQCTTASPTSRHAADVRSSRWPVSARPRRGRPAPTSRGGRRSTSCSAGRSRSIPGASDPIHPLHARRADPHPARRAPRGRPAGPDRARSPEASAPATSPPSSTSSRPAGSHERVRPRRRGFGRGCAERSGRRGRRPAQRRQVDAGQPDPGPAGGRGRGQARGDARPGGLRRHLERPALHRGRHRRLGAGRPRARRPRRRAGRAGGRCRRRRAVRRRRDRRRDGRRRGGRPGVAALRPARRPRREQGGRRRVEADAMALWWLGLGEPYPVSALHGRGSGDLLDAVLAALPEAPREIVARRRGPRRVALLGRPNVGKSSLLNRLAGRSGRSSTPRRGRRGTRSTRWSTSAARPGASSTRRVCGGGFARPPAPSTTRRCGPRRRWPTRRWRWCCSTRASRSPSRTSESCRSPSTLAGRSSSRSTSGIWWTRTAATTSSARSTATSPATPGHPGSTSRRGPDARSTSSPSRLHKSLTGWETRISTGRLNAWLSRWSRRRHRPRGAGDPEGAVRDAGRHPTAALRHVQHGIPRGGLPAVPRAAVARGIRLRRHADRGVGAGARQGEGPLTRPHQTK